MIAFIILHYMNLNDTNNCVESIIKSCKDEDYKIVIVDNGATEESKEFFRVNYTSNQNVYVLYNEKNLGFSAGNNVGCKFAAENFKPDFMCVLNNDIELKQTNFCQSVEEIYREKAFDILGPEIFDVTENRNLNPSHSPGSLRQVEEDFNKLNFCKKFLKLGTIAYWLSYRLYDSFVKRDKNLDFGLCGAALIFSKKYYDRFAQVFPELTFIYCEESFLVYRVKKYGLTMIYDERVSTRHLGSKSTNAVYKSRRKRYEFKVNAQLEALSSLINVYKTNADI